MRGLGGLLGLLIAFAGVLEFCSSDDGADVSAAKLFKIEGKVTGNFYLEGEAFVPSL
jgi:hypothetical protein